jgi:hypothetical protein
MKLLISRLAELEHGFDISLDDSSNVQRIALINGNKADHSGPVILLNLDPHIVYGLSHPAVVGKILSNGQPQELWTTKDLAHKLYEHGMKSSWGTVKHKNLIFQTRSDTFYMSLQSGPIFSAETYSNAQETFVGVKLQIQNSKEIILTSRQQVANSSGIVVPVENIKTFTCFDI